MNGSQQEAKRKEDGTVWHKGVAVGNSIVSIPNLDTDPRGRNRGATSRCSDAASRVVSYRTVRTARNPTAGERRMPPRSSPENRSAVRAWLGWLGQPAPRVA